MNRHKIGHNNKMMEHKCQKMGHTHTHQGSALPLPHIGAWFFFIFLILKPKETSRKKT